ncbi:MAG: glycogen-binding domain-containing protein [Treponema sp.]|nr:glycogen-binding domain-containing protein [Treponema sp.]
MKTIYNFVFLIIIALFSPAIAQAYEWESSELLDRLLSISGPGLPVVHGDYIIFTADSNLRRVGVAFAYEGFGNVHWFRQLLVSQDRLFAPIAPGQKTPEPFKDSGIQFHVHKIPAHLRELEYRLVINGLWTVDPFNENTRMCPVSGLNLSVLRMPLRQTRPNPLNGLPDGLHFLFRGPPGEIVTIAGNFNGWDPFMYELKEGPAGVYNITIPLPPGTYQYVFFNRGQRFVDPHNPRRIYARDGSAASEIVVP